MLGQHPQCLQQINQKLFSHLYQHSPDTHTHCTIAAVFQSMYHGDSDKCTMVIKGLDYAKLVMTSSNGTLLLSWSYA